MEPSSVSRPLGAADCSKVGSCAKTAVAGAKQALAEKGRAVEFRVLGPLEVRDGDRSLALAGAKQRALLALLLLKANRVVSRERLID
jgi:DNA-binding response OmpR family regulator